ARSGEDDVGREVVRDALCVSVLTAADRLEQIALGDDAGAWALGVEHHRGAYASLGHQPCGFAQRVLRSDREDHLAHAVTYMHARERSFRGASLQRLPQSTSR